MTPETDTDDNTWTLIQGFRFMSVVALIGNKLTDAKNREDAADEAKFSRLLDALSECAEEQAETFRQARKGNHFQITPKKS